MGSGNVPQDWLFDVCFTMAYLISFAMDVRRELLKSGGFQLCGYLAYLFPLMFFPFCLFFLLLDEGTGFVLVYYQAGRRRRRSSVRTKTVRTFVDAKKGIDKVQLYVFTRAFLFSIQYFLPLAHFDEMCLTLSWGAVLSTCNSC